MVADNFEPLYRFYPYNGMPLKHVSTLSVLRHFSTYDVFNIVDETSTNRLICS